MVDDWLRLPWVITSGGPHLVIPERWAPAWEGIFAPSGGRVVDAAFSFNPEGPATDYDRACEVKGWLGAVPVGRGQGLVLSSEDSPTAYYQWNRRRFFLRCLYAESEAGLLDYFHEVWEQLPVEEEELFRHPGGKVFLMDSSDVPGRWWGNHAEFVLPRGRYRVLTTHSATQETYIVIHEFRRDRPGGSGKKSLKAATKAPRRRGEVKRVHARTSRCT